MLRYVVWLGLLGTFAASSMQPYFSVVIKCFRDHQLLPVAVGDLLADARRGLKMRQQRLVPSDTRLPTPIALDMLLAAKVLRDILTWTPASLPSIKLFRALLAVCVNYTFFCHAETGSPWLTDDLTVDKPS
jgi:hypothetical protein